MRSESSVQAVDCARSSPASPGLLFWLSLACILFAGLAPAHAASRCHTPSTALRRLHRKLCVKAHVYREITLDDGARILDVCKPGAPASRCHFAFVSLDRHRAAVGSLSRYVGKEIAVRGVVKPIHGRAEILLTRASQIHLAARHHRMKPAAQAHANQARAHRSRFHPNPELLKAFNATRSRMPIRTPAFRSSSGR